MIKKIITSPFVVFPVITCIFLWPLSFFVLSVKNDALAFYFPIRTLVSDALNNGELPLWTPFINMGYPLHADMQSGAWNPVTWLFSFISDYSLAAFHYEMLFYISFAGIGFYFLCREYGAGKALAFALAFAYQFCGFITDAAQFLTCVSSACYLPFVFLFFKRTVYGNRWQDAVYTGLVLFFLFTGGYPALFIIICYLLLAYSIFVWFTSTDKSRLYRKTIPLFFLMLSVFAVLALPAILSFVDYLPLIKRGAGITLSVARENPMHPFSVFSVVAPFANTANHAVLRHSVLMQNIYFGIIPFIFLIFLLTAPGIRIPKEARFFLIAAAIFLMLSWGGFFFLHKLAYWALPLFNRFRHPGLIRLPVIFLVLLAINLCTQNWLVAGRPFRGLMLRITGGVFITLLLYGIFIVATGRGQLFQGLSGSLSDTANFQRLHFSERYLVQLPFLLLLLLVCYKFISGKRPFYWMTLVIAADMFVAVQLVMPVTVVGSRRMKSIEAHLQRSPERFPLPTRHSIHENSDETEDSLSITGSLIPFTKKIGRNDYYITPGNLLLQDSFYVSPIKNLVFENNLVYMADSLVDNKLLTLKREGRGKGVLYTDLQQTRLTAASINGSAEIKITHLSANTLEARLDPSMHGALVLLQNYYPGWKAFINGKEQNIERVNISYMAVEVPPGSTDLRFVYRPVKIIVAFYIALTCFIGVLILIIADIFFRRREEKIAGLNTAS